MKDGTKAERRGFLRALGLGAAAAGTAQAQRADSMPAGQAAKENEAQRMVARYQAYGADVQAFYRTSHYEQ